MVTIWEKYNKYYCIKIINLNNEIFSAFFPKLLPTADIWGSLSTNPCITEKEDNFSDLN